MFLQGVVYFAIVLMAEYGLFRRLWTSLSQTKTTAIGSSQVDIQGEHVDSDVSEEEKRITETPISNLQETDSLILKVSYSWLLKPQNTVNKGRALSGKGNRYSLSGVNGFVSDFETMYRRLSLKQTARQLSFSLFKRTACITAFLPHIFTCYELLVSKCHGSGCRGGAGGFGCSNNLSAVF